MMKVTFRSELPQLAIIAAMFIAGALCWSGAPALVAVQWDLEGNVIRYGNRIEALFGLPALALALYAALLLLPRIDPGYANYQRFPAAYTALRATGLLFIAVVFGALLAATRGHEVEVNRIVMLAAGALLVVIGNYLGKIRPNWFVGIRTPWTLSSKAAWTKTHRLGGWLLVGTGALVMLADIAGTRWAFLLLIAVAPPVALWLVVYSFLVWRGDAERVPPSGTLPDDEA